MLLLAPRSPIASGKSKAAALFPEVSWSQIDGDVGYRKFEAAILESC